MKKNIENKFKRYVFLIFIPLFICLLVLSLCDTGADSENKDSDEKLLSQKAVAVGNYSYYVPKDSEINYDDIMVTVNCDGYGIKSFCLSDAPETEDAVSKLYNTTDGKQFTNKNNVEGLVIEYPYEENTIVKAFCFTADNTFHAIEVWAAPGISEKIAYSIFDSIAFFDANELIEKELQEDAVKAANELNMYDSINEPPTGAYF